MAANTHARFVGSIPENYDRYLGPAHFEPFANDLAGRVAAARPQGAVLEIACGTGIVTKQLRARLPSTVRLVATDLNQPMLDHARAKLADASIEWQQADAMALPFEASSFGAVACGFGVMFMPDKSLAFRESRRVLITGGAFVFNVWDGFEGNECSRVAFDAIRTFFGGDAPAFMKIPFGFNDRDLIRRLQNLIGAVVRRRKKRSAARNAPLPHRVVGVRVCEMNQVVVALLDRLLLDEQPARARLCD